MGTFSNVNMQGVNRQKSEFDLSHVVNTTAEFGSVFPINVQDVPIRSTVQLAVASTVRLDPLKAPTFGNLFEHFTHTIVPKKLLYPYYENVILHTPVSIPGVGTVTPAYLPRVGSFSLTLLVLAAGKAITTIYRKETNGKFAIIQEPSDFSNHLSAALGISVAGANFLITDGLQYSDASYVLFTDPTHADFVTNYSYSGTDYFITFTFVSKEGCNLYKYFLSCGYKPTINHNDDYDVTILPLMAAAKSYFDSYRIPMYDNYKDCPVYKLYSWYLNHLPTRINILVSETADLPTIEEYTLFMSMLTFIAEAFYSCDVDYVSAHLPRPDLPAYDKMQYNNFNYLRHTGYGADVSNNFNLAGQTPGFIAGNNSFGQLDDELLKIMYYSANKTSQAGYQLEKLLRERGYDTYVDECQSSFIGREKFPISISSVTSLAETDKGQLGEFAGLAVERNESDFYNIEITEPSYVVSLLSVCPDDGYMGSLDKTVLGVDQFSCYNPEFDGFGYEISPKSIYGKFDQFFNTGAGVVDKASFGVIPRYTGYKTRQPLVMGDMIRPRYADYWRPYLLQKQVTPDAVQAEEDQDGYWSFGTFYNNSIPLAGRDWRFPTKYPWLANFNRIFRDDGFHRYSILGQEIYVNYALENIAVHNYVHFKAWNTMLPVADSFETIDKDKLGDGASGNVTVSK